MRRWGAMRCFPLLLLLALLALLLSGCHSALDEAMDSYADARYPTASAQFRAVEPAARHLNPRDFANYALYRGLTHLALGDAQAAVRWVGYAKQCADRDPLVFSDKDRGALLSAWRSMGHLPGEPGLLGLAVSH
jgi:ABC-type oligopeptide transport system substrate-binding subunit